MSCVLLYRSGRNSKTTKTSVTLNRGNVIASACAETVFSKTRLQKPRLDWKNHQGRSVGNRLGFPRQLMPPDMKRTAWGHVAIRQKRQTPKRATEKGAKHLNLDFP